MKKELFAGLVLLVMLAALLLNINQMNSLSDKIIESVQKTSQNAADDDWESAAQNAEKALADWLEKDAYTHIVLRHAEIDSITDSLYDLLEAIYNEEDGSVKSISRKTITNLQSVSDIERIRLGSIF